MPELSLPVFRNRVESRLKSAKDVEEFKCVAHSFIQELGFSDFSCGVLMGENDFEIIVSTVPDTMISAYIDNELQLYDTMLECLACSAEYVFQKNIFDHELSAPYENDRRQKNRIFKSIMEDHSIYDNVAIPIHNCADGDREVTAVSIYCRGLGAADFRNRVEGNLVELQMLASAFHRLGYKSHGLAE